MNKKINIDEIKKDFLFNFISFLDGKNFDDAFISKNKQTKKDFRKNIMSFLSDKGFFQKDHFDRKCFEDNLDIIFDVDNEVLTLNIYSLLPEQNRTINGEIQIS